MHLHLPEVRQCYQQGLNSRPDLQGRVAIRFAVGPSGQVAQAITAQSDIGAHDVERCIAAAVRRWTFPAPPGGGIVLVTYPFVFSTSGS